MRRDWPGTLLAERLEITPRTVRRDIDRLRDLGYSIRATMGPDGGYRLDAGEELPPLLFDDEQVIALAVALQASSTMGAGTEEAALRALTTVRQVMPSRLRHRLDALQFTAMTGTRGPSLSPATLVGISAAVRAREVLRFDYGDAPEPPSPRRVEPHHLVTHTGRWYLIAWDLDREDWRLFRADRMTLKTPTGPRFPLREIPGGSAHEFVARRFRGSDDGSRWPCVGTVILGLPARDVLPFAGDGTVVDLGEGRCSLTSGAWSWGALAATLLQFETDLAEVEPPELGAAFAVLAARAVKASAPGN